MCGNTKREKDRQTQTKQSRERKRDVQALWSREMNVTSQSSIEEEEEGEKEEEEEEEEEDEEAVVVVVVVEEMVAELVADGEANAALRVRMMQRLSPILATCIC